MLLGQIIQIKILDYSWVSCLLHTVFFPEARYFYKKEEESD